MISGYFSYKNALIFEMQDQYGKYRLLIYYKDLL